MPKNQSKNSKRKNVIPPVYCPNFSVDNFSYTEMEIDNERNKAQMIAYPRYNHPGKGENSFIFQTDWIQLTQYGLPRKGVNPGDFYMDDKERTFLKIPLDPNQESCVQLENMLQEIDDHNEANKAEIFKSFAASKKTTGAKAAKLFTYQSIVRSPQVDDDFGNLGGDGEKKEKFKYCKMQFTTSYPDRNITSGVFIRKEGADVPKNERVTEVNVSTASDLEAEGLGWGAKVRMIVMVNKLWAAKSKNAQTKTRGFGVTMKILQLEVVPREKSGSIREQFSRYAFIDEEDEEEVEDEEVSEEVEDEEVDSEEVEDEELEAEGDDEGLDEGVEDEEDEEDEVEEDEEDEEFEEDEEDEELEEEDDEEEEIVETKPARRKSNKKKGGRTARKGR